MNGSQLFFTNYNSPAGLLNISVSQNGLRQLFFVNKDNQNPVGNKTPFSPDQKNIVQKIILQLDQYFSGKRKYFNLPLDYKGTPFQMAVWELLKEIPYGTTCSYSDIARSLKKPAASRAVGRAVASNPISIIIPCHRVIGKNGSLVGFGGGLKTKEWLLNFEINNLTE